MNIQPKTEKCQMNRTIDLMAIVLWLCHSMLSIHYGNFRLSLFVTETHTIHNYLIRILYFGFTVFTIYVYISCLLLFEFETSTNNVCTSERAYVILLRNSFRWNRETEYVFTWFHFGVHLFQNKNRMWWLLLLLLFFLSATGQLHEHKQK